MYRIWLTGLLALLGTQVQAESYYVSPTGRNTPPFASWETAATSIQGAVTAAAATPSATVWVRKGIYTGVGTDPVVTITRPLIMKSESGNPADVIIDGQSARRGILVVLKEDNDVVTISGITVQDGFVNASNGHGSGIFLDHTAIPGGRAELTRCVISNCVNESPRHHNRGGGLASIGKAGSNFHTIVSGCRIAGNSVLDNGGFGGGAAFLRTRLTMDDCIVEKNRAGGTKSVDGFGGGVNVQDAPAGSVIRRSQFRDNIATDGGGGGTGGGLRVSGDGTELVIERCVFTGNTNQYGSGVMHESGKLTLRQCQITNNSAGRAFYQGWANSKPSTRVEDCTIAGKITLGSPDTFHGSDALRNPALWMDENGKTQPVRTLAQWEHRRAQILRRIALVAGPLPDKSQFPPPEIKVLKDEVLDDKLRRQLIEYSTDSRSAPRVKAWLFSPTPASPLEADPLNRQSRAAVLCLHQTNRKIGKNEPAGLGGDKNMAYALELARRGFVTLAPDFTGSGEHPSLATYPNTYLSGTMKGVADHIRAVDILSQCECVDPERIGCLGHSLGGFNTMFVSVFEPRIKAIVSSCGYVSWQAYADREGSLYPMAGGNYMPLIKDYNNRADLVPFDWHEVVAACAPRPLFVNAPLRDDPFLVEGVCETLAAAKPIYALYGADAVVHAEHPNGGHSFPPEVREKSYQFLERHLAHK